jgi:RNA recognition motif-containing protein
MCTAFHVYLIQHSYTPSLSNTFFLLSLHAPVTEEGFYAFFNQFGPIVDSVVMVDRLTKRSRGFGFVTFANAVSVVL